MKRQKISSFIYFLGFIMMLGAFYAFTTNTVTRSQNPPDWENLKVLPQDISKDSLIGLMKGYEKALGVNCSFCHAPRKDNPNKLDFASDAKIKKKIARGMIKMVHEINANYFRPHYPDPKPAMVTDVSCVMCHRGTNNPKEYLQGVGTLYPEVVQKNDAH